MRFAIIILTAVMGMSCTSNYNKNETIIQMLTIDKEIDKGYKNVVIKDHHESTKGITVFVEATDALNIKHKDTIAFRTTGDGYIIK